METDSVSPTSGSANGSDHDEARRRFLVQCGRYAAITPPVVTVLLSVSQSRYATAASGVNSASGTTSRPGAGSFALSSDGTCAQAQGTFVGDSPGCVRLRSRVDPTR